VPIANDMTFKNDSCQIVMIGLSAMDREEIKDFVRRHGNKSWKVMLLPVFRKEKETDKDISVTEMEFFIKMVKDKNPEMAKVMMVIKKNFLEKEPCPGSVERLYEELPKIIHG